MVLRAAVRNAIAMNSPSLFPGLPDEVLRLMESSLFTEFATVSAQGVPIDTPTFSFMDFGRGCIDIATGLAYPAKAERARRNPKVGLLLEGLPNEPVVSIAAHAAVSDANIQANIDRYISETIAYFAAFSNGQPWSVARTAIWYWSRIFVSCAPVRIRWWPNAAAMDMAPNCWSAPAGTVPRRSDPAPLGKGSAAPSWPTASWQERATEVLGLQIEGHLSVIDDEGYPLPIRVRSVSYLADGFEFDVPRSVPWKFQGNASLCFAGSTTFVGKVESAGAKAHFVVERVLPRLPLVNDPNEIWAPSQGTRSALMDRLEQELSRRGLDMPTTPLEPPAPTEGSRLRAARMQQITEHRSFIDDLRK